MNIINYYIIINDIIINSALSLTTKEVGVAHGTTIYTIHSSVRLALFLLIAKDKFDINGLLNNSSFQQSRLES